MSSDLSNGLSKETPILEDAPWVSVALADLGIGSLNGKAKVKSYLQTVHAPLYDDKGDITAWCSAFANSCMKRLNVQGTNSALALSWKTWGYAVPNPRLGDVAVFWRIEKNDRTHTKYTTPHGHVGFFIRHSGPDLVVILGGNQGTGAVRFGKLPINAARMGLLGFRRPIFNSPPVAGTWA